MPCWIKLRSFLAGGQCIPVLGLLPIRQVIARCIWVVRIRPEEFLKTIDEAIPVAVGSECLVVWQVGASAGKPAFTNSFVVLTLIGFVDYGANALIDCF